MYVEGTNGFDSITGYNGDDTYYLKKGNDIVKDYSGNDSYTFTRGDGQDRITDSAGTDKIDFYSGIETGDLFFTRDNNNVVIGIENSTDKINIVDWFTNSKYKIENIITDDGATITSADIELAILNGGNLGKVFTGSLGNDSITGTVGSDTINALAGNDIVFALQGHDIITGGTGNDFMNGGDGNDTYIFNKGDGRDVIYDPDSNNNSNNDTIKFGTGITADDLIFLKEDYNLVIKLNNNNDQITINDYYYPPEFFETKIERFAFANGTFLTDQDVENRVINVITGNDENNLLNGTLNKDSIDGKAGDDDIYGLEGDDILIGGAGNDYLGGNYGNDTYIFNKGDGQDIIDDWGGDDTIKLGAGITMNDIELIANEGLNLKVQIKNSTDSIVIDNWDRYSDDNKIENIVFNTGESVSLIDWTESSVRGNYFVGTDSNDNLIGAWADDTIYGLAGDDFLDGGADTSYGYPSEHGSDYLDGGAGNDMLMGYDGTNTLLGGTGDDMLSANSGNDIYVFNRGDGRDIIWDSNPDTGDGGGSTADTIKFGPNIQQSDIAFTRENEDLKASIKGSNDSITVGGNYLSDDYGYNNFKIEYFLFSDGSILTDKDAENIVKNPIPDPTVVGIDGYDNISGHNGNDIYYLKKGNDNVKDYSGSDSYLFYQGDGADRITDSSGTDKIRFASSVYQSNLAFSRVFTNSLQITVKGTTDSITVIDWFANSKYQIEKVEFNDGTYMSNYQINQIVQQMSTFNGNEHLALMSNGDLTNNQYLILVQS